MKNRPFPIIAGAVVLVGTLALSSFAQAGGLNRSRREARSCRAAILSQVRSARVGTPARPIPWWAQRRVASQIQGAIAEGLSESQAEPVFYSRLENIRNTYWRRDLAQAAAALVGDAPSECS